ncbi:ABC transporter ATP-binding protein [Uliginosibacterium sediminicola]|uniref:ABC transporter ATP-binding protein n=1 Tax=Uliginosibacterium sediminicola TaxID=2024550 RepID=A0ABU9Z2Z3_9RHOO
MSALTIESLHAGYRKRPVLKDLSLAPVQPGTVVALLGANAAGKSTLLRTLAGQLRPTSGSLRLGEHELIRLDAHTRRRLIAYLPQSLPAAGALFAWEAVSTACSAAHPGKSARARDQLTEAVFTRLGIAALALRRMGELSGGQRQMLGLAQALVRQTPLLLLDEPTSALDPRWQLEVLNVIREDALAREATILLVVHDLNLAVRFCDRVVVLDGGHVIAEGAPATALTPAVLRQAYGIAGRIEHCSQGKPMVIADHALPHLHGETA